MFVCNDPLNIRDGERLKFFENNNKLSESLVQSGFSNIRIGSCDNDWWGINEHYWIVSCNKI